VCERWVYDPYFQHFTSETSFQHQFAHERSDLIHWRKRLGSKLDLLLAESLRLAHAAGALRTPDLKRVTVDFRTGLGTARFSTPCATPN
jgi:IS5 family transposase